MHDPRPTPDPRSLAAYSATAYRWMSRSLGVAAAVAWWAAQSPSVDRYLVQPRPPLVALTALAALGFQVMRRHGGRLPTPALALALLGYAALVSLTLCTALLKHGRLDATAAFLAGTLACAVLGLLSGLRLLPPVAGVHALVVLAAGCGVAAWTNRWLESAHAAWLLDGAFVTGLAVVVARSQPQLQRAHAAGVAPVRAAVTLWVPPPP